MGAKSTKKKSDKAMKAMYKPNLKRMTAVRSGLAAKQVEVLQRRDIEHRTVKMVVRGQSYDTVSRKLGITTAQAHKIVQDTCNRWLTDDALSSVQARELMVRQLDSVLALAMHEAFPHPLKNDVGLPLMIKTCKCEDLDCDLDGHRAVGMSTPDIRWAAMVDDLLERKAKLLGLDAASKLEAAKVDILSRSYIGVSQKVIDAL